MLQLAMINILTFLSVEPGRTEQHAGAHLGVVVEVPLAGRALAGSPPDAALAALVAPPAPPGAVVTKEPSGARAHTHPGEGTSGTGLWCQHWSPPASGTAPVPLPAGLQSGVYPSLDSN